MKASVKNSTIFIVFLFLTSCCTTNPTSLSKALERFAIETHNYGFISKDDLISKNKALKDESINAIKTLQCEQGTPNPVVLGIKEAKIEFNVVVANKKGASVNGSMNPSAEILVQNTSTTANNASFTVIPDLLSTLPNEAFNPDNANLLTEEKIDPKRAKSVQEQIKKKRDSLKKVVQDLIALYKSESCTERTLKK